MSHKLAFLVFGTLNIMQTEVRPYRYKIEYIEEIWIFFHAMTTQDIVMKKTLVLRYIQTSVYIGEKNECTTHIARMI